MSHLKQFVIYDDDDEVVGGADLIALHGFPECRQCNASTLLYPVSLLII